LLLTNEKVKSIFTRRLLRSNLPGICVNFYFRQISIKKKKKYKRENNSVHTYKEFRCIYMYQKVYQDFGFCVLIKLKEQSNMDNPETVYIGTERRHTK